MSPRLSWDELELLQPPPCFVDFRRDLGRFDAAIADIILLQQPPGAGTFDNQWSGPALRAAEEAGDLAFRAAASQMGCDLGKLLGRPSAEKAAVTVLSLAESLGYRVCVDPFLRPFRERERSRDGSCVNLSAIERNRKRREDAAKVFVLERERVIVCAPHVFEAMKTREAV